jgi:two-component sensor histidine kinase
VEVLEVQRLSVKVQRFNGSSKMPKNDYLQKAPVISFKKALILAFIIAIVYAMTLFILKDGSILKTTFNEFSSALINLMAAISLIYAAKLSAVYGRRVYVAWGLIAAAQLFDAINDIFLGLFNIGLHQTAPSLMINLFFLAYFILFALGIYLFPRTEIIQKRWHKLSIDVSILFITVFMVSWTFFIMPAVGVTGDLFDAAIHLTGIVLYTILLFLMVDLVSSQAKTLYKTPLLFLASSVSFQILSNILAIYPPFQESYALMNLMYTSWVASYLTAFLAGMLQANTLNMEKPQISSEYTPWYTKSGLISYLPSIGVLSAYILLVWSYNQHIHDNFPVLEVGVGFIIGLLLLHQAISIRENEKLYKAAEDEIRYRKEVEARIESSLREKEALLKEIHHRVKNNLQIISSLLSLQSSYIEDETAIDILQESRNRVKSMANVHEKLYHSKDLSKISFKGYIEDMTRELSKSYGSNQKIQINTEIEDVSLGIETAVPFGLIINEIVSNSFKHAFPDGMSGEISIKLTREGEDLTLIIRDSGIGLSEDLDLNKTKSMGLTLVNALVMQLDGKMELQRDGGTAFKIKFKELEYKKRM